MKIYYDYPKDFTKIINEFNYKVLKIKSVDLTSPYDIGLNTLSSLNIIKSNEKQSNKAFLLQNYNFILEYNKSNVVNKRHKFKNKYTPTLSPIKIDKPKKVKKVKNKKPIVKLIAGIDVTTTEFLSTFEWRKLRMEAILLYGNKCQCCGKSPKENIVINVDHVKPRKIFPELALKIENLQILCDECNHGKGNWDETDWR